MLIRLTDGQPENYTIGQLRRDNPTISFPSNIPAEILEEYSVYPVKQAPEPVYNELTQFVQVADPVKVDGEWTQQWKVGHLPLVKQLKNLQEARAKAYHAEADPLFFRAQRGEASMSEWEAKVQEIRNRYPYPEE